MKPSADKGMNAYLLENKKTPVRTEPTKADIVGSIFSTSVYSVVRIPIVENR